MEDTAVQSAEPELAYESHAAKAIHVERVRSFRNDRELKVECVATAANPYKDEADMDIYDDDHGYEYWLDPVSGRLLQAGPRAGLGAPPYPKTAVLKPVAELREIAVALATGAHPDFMERRSAFHPYEDNRRGQLFFFRWEVVNGDDRDIPPFLQVGLYADGTLACFTDILPASVPAAV